MSNNNNNNAIPSPEEWLEITGLPFPEGRAEIMDSMRDYAAHIAALVHRNTRHLAAEITVAEGDTYDPAPIAARRAYNRIINIPLRAVYPAPAREENREG